MARSISLRAGTGGAAALAGALAVLLGACTGGGDTKDGSALAAASDGKPPARRCEVSSYSADIGTTRTVRCIEDPDRDGVPDAIEVTTRTDSSHVTCVRSEREGDRWRQVAPCIPEP